MKRWMRRSLSAAVLVAASPLLAPQLLAFPYSAEVAGHRIYSEQPIGAEIEPIVAAANARVAVSPLAAAQPSPPPIFLTEGGWRWTWLAATSRRAFALTRPLSEAIIVNRSDPTADRVFSGTGVGSWRTLSGTIAHEATHGLIRARFGILADLRYPAWLREGYCDHVAGGGSLSDAEARRLIREHRRHPALPYWIGRKRVEAALAAPGGSVESLFANPGA